MRLILTTFDYQMDNIDGGRTNRGSYLGRKPASEKTIRRFLLANARTSGLGSGRVLSVKILHSAVSPWIAH